MIITTSPTAPATQRGFAGLRDPIVAVGGAGSPMLGSANQSPTGAPCPDCPSNCQETDVQETWYLSPQQDSPSDKSIPVTRTTKTCNDDALEIDCDNTNAQPTGMFGLGALSNASDAPVPDSTVFVADAPTPCNGSGMGITGLILIVLGVATVTALATSALSSPRRR